MSKKVKEPIKEEPKPETIKTWVNEQGKVRRNEFIRLLETKHCVKFPIPGNEEALYVPFQIVKVLFEAME